MFLKTQKNKKSPFSSGLILLEVVISVSILLIIFLSLIAVYNNYIKISLNNIPLIKSSYLLEEGVEAVKIMRDTSWSSKIAPITLDTNYYLVYDSGLATFDVTLTPENPIDSMYQRTIVFSSVFRDSDDDIQSSGTLDPDTLKVTVTVSWYDGSTTTAKQLSTYITNMFSN